MAELFFPSNHAIDGRKEPTFFYFDSVIASLEWKFIVSDKVVPYLWLHKFFTLILMVEWVLNLFKKQEKCKNRDLEYEGNSLSLQRVYLFIHVIGNIFQIWILISL